ncbi:MAG: 6-phospho-3-hexuloisomerase [Gemmatimonadetes bacterium]|nr:6-phospho-3-hexuloisomerase [Gemmatimonadota bacterium]MYD26856.1 6-phospho-3-hexuloisomerase [Gemmatimonadota bacterium]MYI99075.1 6-phospho-3-hexuloisomerase [Gemmatimonadota bacterium]
MDNERASPPFDEIARSILDELRRTLNRISCDEVEALVREVTGARRVFVAGAGRSGLVMRSFAMRLAQLGRPVHVVGETTSPPIRPGDLLLIGSGSGVTDRMVHYAGKAAKTGARVAAATAVPESPAARLADVVVVIPAPAPKSSKTTSGKEHRSHQPMGTLFEQSLGVMLDACVMLLMARLGETGQGMFDRHANLE